MIEFVEFPKIARFSREIIITEKIDGTNACVYVGEDGTVLAGSRSRWITPSDDNFGFAAWVAEHSSELRELGPGRHFGEWWGRGIQRHYDMPCRVFSLFNVDRWSDSRPKCCDVVPVLYRGQFESDAVNSCLVRLADLGSYAAPGFKRPEGVIIYHVAGNVSFKKTLERDGEPKTLQKRHVQAA